MAEVMKKSALYSEDDGPVLVVLKDGPRVLLDGPDGTEIALTTKPFPGDIDNTTPTAAALCDGVWIICAVTAGRCYYLKLTVEDMPAIESEWEDLRLVELPTREACPTDIRGIISLNIHKILFIGTDADGNNNAAIVDFTAGFPEFRAVQPPVHKYISPGLIRHNDAVVVWERAHVYSLERDPEILSLAADAPIPTNLSLPIEADNKHIRFLSDGTYICLLAGNIVNLWDGVTWDHVPVNIPEDAIAELLPVSTRLVMIDPYNHKVTASRELAKQLVRTLEPTMEMDISAVINLE